MSTQRRRVLEDGGLIIPTDGVYIEGINGKFYTVDNWKGGNAANSVIVASGDVKFRIALTQPSNKAIGNSHTDPLEYCMTAISDETAAKADYNGSGNTANIMKLQSSTAYAAGYCNNFIFPDGKTKGFLPSLGQLYLAYQNKAFVDAALAACGGTAMNTSNYYWSSTFWGVIRGNRRCWGLYWSDGDVYFSGYVDFDRFVRPFAAY